MDQTQQLVRLRILQGIRLYVVTTLLLIWVRVVVVHHHLQWDDILVRHQELGGMWLKFVHRQMRVVLLELIILEIIFVVIQHQVLHVIAQPLVVGVVPLLEEVGVVLELLVVALFLRAVLMELFRLQVQTLNYVVLILWLVSQLRVVL